MDAPVPWIILLVLLLVGQIVLRSIAKWRRRRPVEDSPKETPYTIYTTAFDQVIAATELSKRLASISTDHSKGFLSCDSSAWDQATADAEKITENLAEPKSSLNLPRDAAIQLLVDQSGSMKGQPMAYTAAGVRKLTKILQGHGIATEVIGFTTAGWHGGFARQQWIDNGRPQRPGRLCALLHIIYKSFNEDEFSETAWREMLNPDVLRENVDGEAIAFGEARLLERHESNCVLMVISDGAAVDDSTLTENGPSFLYRHVTETISRIQTDGNIQLCAVGINFSVGSWYKSSAQADDGQSLVDAALQLIAESRPPFPT